jgi:hypothetical protein
MEDLTRWKNSRTDNKAAAQFYPFEQFETLGPQGGGPLEP